MIPLNQLHDILVVSHDAGGAEVISSWVRHQRRFRFRFVLEGPAREVFLRKIPDISFCSRDLLLDGLADIDLVLTGTGWASDLEKQAIVLAKKQGVPVASYLDHWVNYQARFLLDGRMVMPDEIWVGDRYAYDLAVGNFPNSRIKLEPDLYLEEMRVAISLASSSQVRPDKAIRILYVCEPLSTVAQRQYNDPRYWGYTEFEALEGYFHYLQKQAPVGVKVRIRPHPAEPQGKYQDIRIRYENFLEIEESTGRTLIEDCAWADWIVGCQSMPLVIGVLAGKQVFSCIPEGGKPMMLPFREIVPLFGKERISRPEGEQEGSD